MIADLYKGFNGVPLVDIKMNIEESDRLLRAWSNRALWTKEDVRELEAFFGLVKRTRDRSTE